MPTDEGTIVAVFTSRQDGSTELKAMVESETGELMEFYVEHISLVPVPK